MSIKLAVFDIDGTLAKTEETIPPHISQRLRSLESCGIRIALISGRTASYLAGLARGIGIIRPLVAGENGGVIFDPANLWEKRLEVIPYRVIEDMRITLLKEFGDVWFQPNQTMLTAAPKNLSRIEELYQIVKNLKQVAAFEFKLNRYDDAIEVMPKENSKGKALAVIKDSLMIGKEEVVVCGNTIVDYPMHTETSDFLIIGDTFKTEGISNYPCIEDALYYLEHRCH